MKHGPYDYIIVGAGTVGATLAKLLTDDNSTSVLLLEAGVDLTTDPGSTSPSFGVAAVASSDNKHSFQILTNNEAPINIQSLIHGGRKWGGSSEHNFFYSIRGSPEYWNNLATTVNDSNWNYNNISQFFIQNETYTGVTQSPVQRGTNGPLFIRQSNFPSTGTIANLLANALNVTTGIPIIEDYNVATTESISVKSQYNQKEISPNTFIRQSSATSYLNSNIVTPGSDIKIDSYGIGHRKLHISSKSTVNKIILGKKCNCCHHTNNYKAKGVVYDKNGKTKHVYATKGVIICAYFNSASILQRSGIGKMSELEPLGIQTLIDNPNVGHNLQSHVAAPFMIQSNSDIILPILFSEPALSFTHARVANVAGPEPYPGIQILNVPIPFVPPAISIPKEWNVDPTAPFNYITSIIVNTNPKSRGSIVISHSDPNAMQTSKLGFFTDTDGPSLTYPSYDANLLVKALQLMYTTVLQMRVDSPTKTFNILYPDESIFLLPGATPGGDQYRALYNFVLANPVNFVHFGGTTRMSTSPIDGVVDSNLNVFGVDNLKIADIGILPNLSDGNTSIPAFAIAYRAFQSIQTP
jgi:choline dehydrogenase